MNRFEHRLFSGLLHSVWDSAGSRDLNACWVGVSEVPVLSTLLRVVSHRIWASPLVSQESISKIARLCQRLEQN